MNRWIARLPLSLLHNDKPRQAPKARPSFLPRLEELERRESPVSLFNPLFASEFGQLDDLAQPTYTIVPGWNPAVPDATPGQGGDAGSGGTNSGQGGSTPPLSDNFSAGDPATAIAAVNLDANLFASVLGQDDASFAANITGAIGGNGGVASSTGAAATLGLPTPAANSNPSSGASPLAGLTPPAVTSGPPPALTSTPGAAGAVGQSLSPSDFGLNPFTLRSGATLSALTPFVVGAGMSLPPPVSGGVNNVNGATTTADAYSFQTGLTTLADGGLSYVETYTFLYDVRTTPASAGAAAVHDWGASGYTFLATNDGGQYSYSLVATLTAYEVGAQAQSNTASDGSTNSGTTTWQSSTQYERTITSTTNALTGATSGTDVGGGVATQASSASGTYSNPIGVGVFGGVGTVSGTDGSLAVQRYARHNLQLAKGLCR